MEFSISIGPTSVHANSETGKLTLKVSTKEIEMIPAEAWEAQLCLREALHNLNYDLLCCPARKEE